MSAGSKPATLLAEDQVEVLIRCHEWTISNRRIKVSTSNTCEYLESNMATSVKIDDELKERIQHLAGLRQRSAHWIMREAIEQYVDHEEKREAFKREAMHAWQTYCRDGRHLTLEEADAWLAKLATGEDVEPPPCHD